MKPSVLRLLSSSKKVSLDLRRSNCRQFASSFQVCQPLFTGSMLLAVFSVQVDRTIGLTEKSGVSIFPCDMRNDVGYKKITGVVIQRVVYGVGLHRKG